MQVEKGLLDLAVQTLKMTHQIQQGARDRNHTAMSWGAGWRCVCVCEWTRVWALNPEIQKFWDGPVQEPPG